MSVSEGSYVHEPEMRVRGRIRSVQRKIYCVYLDLISEDDKTEVTWVFEPEVWFEGPYRDAAPGRMAECTGRIDRRKVSRRGETMPKRYRASKPLQVDTLNRAASSDPLLQENVLPNAMAEPQARHEMITRLIMMIVKDQHTGLVWIHFDDWYCFSAQSLLKVLSGVAKAEICQCILSLVRDGELAVASVEEGLYIPITYETVIMPALLLIMHHPSRFARHLVINSGVGTTGKRGNWEYTLDEWIEITMKQYLNKLHVSREKVLRGIDLLIEGHHVFMTKEGSYKICLS